MTGYDRKPNGNTTMHYKISDKQLLKKYNIIQKRVETLLKIEFDSEPVYGDSDKYIKTEIKIYAGSIITNFQSKKKTPKEKAPCKCLSILMLVSNVYRLLILIHLSKQRKSIILKHFWKNANMNKK